MGNDVDILVVYRGQKREDAYAVVKKVLHIPGLEPHIYMEEEYGRMKRTLSKMIEGGVVRFSKDEGR